MIVPNKFTTLDESILGKLQFLIMEDINEISLPNLINMKLKYFTDIGELILALDTLYILGRIEIDEEGVVKYVS